MTQRKGCVEIKGGVAVGRIKQGLNAIFKIEERGSTISTELLEGLTIFLTHQAPLWRWPAEKRS
jgi:hypothetical protein